MVSVVCAYQIKTIHDVAEHGLEKANLTCCSLHSGEVCWVTSDSLLNCRPDLQWSSRVPIRLPIGLDGEHAQTVVEIAHPYPVNSDAMFQRMCRIEALLRTALSAGTHQGPHVHSNAHLYEALAQSAVTPQETSVQSSIASYETPGNSPQDVDKTSDFDSLLREMMGDDYGVLEDM